MPSHKDSNLTSFTVALLNDIYPKKGCVALAYLTGKFLHRFHSVTARLSFSDTYGVFSFSRLQVLLMDVNPAA